VYGSTVTTDALGLFGKVVPDCRCGQGGLAHRTADLVQAKDDITRGVETGNAGAGVVISDAISPH
jgi:hypothetical protein